MKNYTAVIRINGEEVEKSFNVPKLLDTEMFIYNSVQISNGRSGKNDKFIRVKRKRKR